MARKGKIVKKRKCGFCSDYGHNTRKCPNKNTGSPVDQKKSPEGPLSPQVLAPLPTASNSSGKFCVILNCKFGLQVTYFFNCFSDVTNSTRVATGSTSGRVAGRRAV